VKTQKSKSPKRNTKQEGHEKKLHVSVDQDASEKETLHGEGHVRGPN